MTTQNLIDTIHSAYTTKGFTTGTICKDDQGNKVFSISGEYGKAEKFLLKAAQSGSITVVGSEDFAIDDAINGLGYILFTAGEVSSNLHCAIKQTDDGIQIVVWRQ